MTILQPTFHKIRDVDCGSMKAYVKKTFRILHFAFAGCGLREVKNQNIQLKDPALYNLWFVGCGLQDSQTLQNKQSFRNLKQTNKA